MTEERPHREFVFYHIVDFLKLSEEDFKRLMLELPNWHREIKKLNKNGDFDYIGLRWIDDGQLHDVAVDTYFSDIDGCNFLFLVARCG